MSLMRWARGVVLAVAIGSLPMATLVAQEPQPPVPPQKGAGTVAPKPVTPLKVTVVISRWQGDKKTASLPFTLSANANDSQRGTSTLRMSEEVPVPQGAMSAPNLPVASYTYRQIGTNIDVRAETLDEGRFAVLVTIDDSQVFTDAAKPSGLPSFQSFRSTVNAILKDGQTTQYTTATDKISGEVVKVDVTLNVIR